MLSVSQNSFKTGAIGKAIRAVPRCVRAIRVAFVAYTSYTRIYSSQQF